MAKSGRSRRPGSPPPGPAGRARPPAPPSRVAASRSGRPAGAEAEVPEAGPATASTRLKRKGTGKDAGRPQRAPDLKVRRPSPVKRAFDWLLEDPSKRKRRQKSEREKALEAMAARPERAPAAPPRTLKERVLSAFHPGTVLALDDAPKKAARPPGRTARLVHQALGESTAVDAYGDRVVVPPPPSDWRWRVSRFLRSDVRGIALLRTSLLVFLLLASTWTVVYANTGFDLTEVAFGTPDPDNPATNHTIPFFIVESGSMMHPNSPYGRVGTIDPGDLVVVEKVGSRGEIETFYGKGDKKVAGAKGDVLVFVPILPRGAIAPPVVHRAMAYIDMTSVPIPNPRFGEAGQEPYLNVARYTVAEFGIVNAPAITIPELGLVNYAPTNEGFITRGDNPRSNTWSDQALGVTPFPVPFERVVGRVKYEAPVVGLAKIALTGQDPTLLSPDHEWCTFLAGRAACDTWQVFLLGVVLFVGLPLVVTVGIFLRRALRRHAETRALQAWQDEEARRLAALRQAKEESHAAPGLPIHDATDLLTGRVRIDGGPAPGNPRDWNDLVAPGRVRFDDTGP